MKLVSSNGPLDRSVLEALEQYWEFKLPTSYRDFLLCENGGEPAKDEFCFKDETEDGSTVHFFLGVVPVKHLNLLMFIKTYKGRIPENQFPIAYDPCGNLILISVKGTDRGKVYFWDHEMEADTDQGEVPSYDNLKLIADNFDEFINNLKNEDEGEMDIT